MNLLLARPLWGVDLSAGVTPHLPRWRDVGYAAIETSAPLWREHPQLAREGFVFIADVYTDHGRTDGDVARHLASLREQVEEALPHRPLLLNVHSGLDRWSERETEDYFQAALALEQRTGVPFCHETHRRRCLATPWATAALLAKFPALKLTADLSHWVCVTERLLEDFSVTLDLVARHTHHIHARVGHEHGPQVPDPRVPEWQPHLLAHEAWWSQIWTAQRARGLPISTLTPEFGPPPYLWTWPGTGQPAADLADVCDFMARRERGRFAAG